jgi:hypothetical protein
MKKILFGVATLTLFFLAGAKLAKSRPEPRTDTRACSVPKAWGPLKATAAGEFDFEDSSGVIRHVDCQFGQMHVTIQIARQ